MRIVDLRKPKKRADAPIPQPQEPVVIAQEPELEPEPEIPTGPETKEEEKKSPPEVSLSETSWEAPSFHHNPQKKYLIPVIIGLLAGAVALLFYDRDTLLAIFLILSSLVLSLYAAKKPDISKITIDETGVSINERKYYYRELKSFWIDYNPGGFKELSLESRKWYMPYIRVSIENQNPVELRSLMVNFVPEKVHEYSLIDFIARKLGI
jgi:hypothetical protein